MFLDLGHAIVHTRGRKRGVSLYNIFISLKNLQLLLQTL